MPRSILLGRPWPAPGEPLFTPDDTQLALDLQAEDDLACPGCGQPRDESMDPANEDAYTAHRAVCNACSIKDHVRARATDSDRSRTDDDGLYVYVTRST